MLEKPQTVPDQIKVIITGAEKPYTAPFSYFFGLENAASFKTFYWVKEQQPAGSVPQGEEGYFGTPPGSIYYFTLPKLGQYIVSAFAVDENGAARRGSLTFEAENVPPKAVPSVIPGPTELPLMIRIYSCQRHPARHQLLPGPPSICADSALT